ncbi:BetR domain (plasmid) [Corynebacterium mustelae]|uniref:BetR domain n=1 Tax=Corynebacterium mustelae TaxID=571915 RepID=A0A0G3H1W9_9CORY|nr:helix-turn-helix transcriptional regulator [Corynebacterium mustelae]AKK07409.1 BetR domain [Corynebacterium mustelae]
MHTAPQTPRAWSPNACVGKTVSHLLLDRRTTKKELGAALGITGVAIGRKVRGDIGWSLSDLIHVADFFTIDVADLLPIQNPDWKEGDDEQFRWLPAPVKPPKT